MALAPEDDTGRTNHALRFSMASDIVELVVLTGDTGLLQTMRDAVGSSRRLWHAGSADKVSDLLVAGEVGIVVIDVAALRESAAVFVSQIKRQFPDLVVLVAGGRDTELELATQVSAGTVYRFIHKPLSPNRARLFLEAAVRRYGERRRAPIAHPPARRRNGSAWLLVAAGILALLSLLVVLVLSLRPRVSGAPPATLQAPVTSTVLARLLNRAADALAANRLTAPAGDNALELYRQTVGLAPADAMARAGLAEVRERLLARAENALLEERLDEAAGAIETAREAGVEANRVAFLSAQLAKSREQLKIAPGARARAGARPVAPAPPRVRGVPGVPAPADGAATLAGLAVERIAEGQLVQPEHDNARYYVQEALRASPHSDAATEARQTLAARLLIEARAAIDRRDFSAAADWLQSAEGIALPAQIEGSRALLNAARHPAQSDALVQLLKLGTERLGEDRLTEPAGDSALYYLTTLRGLDAQFAGLGAALSELGTRLTGKARQALALRQFAAARGWLDEAKTLGTADTASLARELAQAAERPDPGPDLVPANQLKLLKSELPVYPPKALSEKLKGWVEVDFTVDANGQVTQTAVHAAEPAGVFDAAALRAVARWRYRPVERAGKAEAVRSRVRVRFTP